MVVYLPWLVDLLTVHTIAVRLPGVPASHQQGLVQVHQTAHLAMCGGVAPP
jgi:hypothetical protein